MLFSLIIMLIEHLCIYSCAFVQNCQIGKISQTTILDLPFDHVFISGNFSMVQLVAYRGLCSRFRLGTNNFLEQHRLVLVNNEITVFVSVVAGVTGILTGHQE